MDEEIIRAGELPKEYVRKMTPEEAIEFINKRISIDVRYISTDEFERTKECLHLAISALERRIPKKPDVIKEYDDLDMYYIEFACPNCGAGSAGKKDKPGCCEHCGQALDWSDKDE